MHLYLLTLKLICVLVNLWHCLNVSVGWSPTLYSKNKRVKNLFAHVRYSKYVLDFSIIVQM